METKKITDVMGCTYSEREIARIAELICEAEMIEREVCAKIISGAAAGFCGGRAEIVMRTVANSIRERSNSNPTTDA